MYRRKSRGSNWIRTAVGCTTLGLVAVIFVLVWMFNLGRATSRQLSQPELGLELALARLGLDQAPAGFRYGFDIRVPWTYRITMLSSEPIGATHWDSVGSPGQFFMITQVRSTTEWESWRENPERLYGTLDEGYREFLEFDLGPGRVLDDGQNEGLLFSLRQGGIRGASPEWGQLALFALRCRPEDRPLVGVWAQATHYATPIGPPQIEDVMDRDAIQSLVESLKLCP